ncbi:hypothetical protein HanRHA438_Chr04g0162301 [Helianthus annuus]|uniref:Uncharacterized protein n=1 Tax=Helianthus annuus TaxID=4232 RepID=A0A9K3J501_HELAN|nr:uncharacterized protein LOC110936194 isoform X3 [Helianthus annuus]KAF5809021.1 hypothetical protein HanXRQr2_Chr04g0152271 [Helianthus annuus]KAJ0925667.1 hypothetical protein HanRHA438_Chr04g0162301 [Helianthus annuus]KAJ0930202.1 hypothetical protein HanPSC8_Chr04g0146621 [Helianthus annuus]
MATATDAAATRFKSIKSLPVDYRFMGSSGEKYANSLVSVSVPENGNMDRVVDDDSPYGSVLGSWGNKKWGYTASYVAKKEGGN